MSVPSIFFVQPFVQDPIQLPPSFPLSFGIVSPSIGSGLVSIYLATIVYRSSRPIGPFSASPSVHSLLQVFSVYYWSSTASAFSSASSSASLHFCPSSPRYFIVAQYPQFVPTIRCSHALPIAYPSVRQLPMLYLASPDILWLLLANSSVSLASPRVHG